MKSYVLPVIGCGLLALIAVLYYVSRTDLMGRPPNRSVVTLAAPEPPAATQSQSIVQPKVVGPGNVAVGPKPMVVNPPIQATKAQTNGEQTNASPNLPSRHDYVPKTEVDNSSLPAVVNPVRIADGFEKVLQPQLADNTLQTTETNKLHMLLESEVRDETWATYIEQKISRYVDSYLGQKRIKQDALVLHVVACGQTMCEAQVSIASSAMNNPALDWQTINRQMVRDVFADKLSGNNTAVTTLSNRRIGFVSFYRRRK